LGVATDPLANPEDAIRRVYAYVAYRTGAGADADDIVSDTIERALRYRSSFDPRRGSAAGWLIGIASNCIADHYRDGAGRVDADVEQIAEPATEFTSSVEGSIDLHAAVARLDARDRELIALRYGADLKAKDIARLLEMKPNAVEVALHRAVARLRELMGET